MIHPDRKKVAFMVHMDLKNDVFHFAEVKVRAFFAGSFRGFLALFHFRLAQAKRSGARFSNYANSRKRPKPATALKMPKCRCSKNAFLLKGSPQSAVPKGAHGLPLKARARFPSGTRAIPLKDKGELKQVRQLPHPTAPHISI